MSELILNTIEQIANHRSLATEHSYQVFNHILTSDSLAHISALLSALKVKGETETEILGAIQALMSHHTPLPDVQKIKQNAIVADCCGTGGDGQSTLNISTAVAIIASTQNIKIAKHGNRAISSRCGASDVIAELGKGKTTPQQASDDLKNHHLCFLHAPDYHPMTQNIAKLRTHLKFRTIFNLLGPFINPAKPDYQLLGVYLPKYTRLCANILKAQGVKRALVIHGQGTDEMAIHGQTIGHFLNHGRIRPFTIVPEEVGLKRYELSSIKGGDSAYNARALEDLLKGQGSLAYQAVVALNAGALFYITEVASNIQNGVELAKSILKSDQGYQKLQALKGAQCSIE